MPAPRTKTYLVKVAAGVNPTTPPVPTNPRRVGLFIQNTGGTPGLMRFADPVKGDGSDIAVAAGAILPPWTQADTTPREAINFFSQNGTTFCVMETVEGDG
jgi:hypothetical protein